MNVLERLRVRLQSRQSIHYVHDDYDGAQPAGGIKNVALSENDVQLMWVFFDYVSISGEKYKEATSSAFQDTERESHIRERLGQRANVGMGLNDTDAVNQAVESASSHSNLEVDMQSLQTDSVGSFMDNWSLFGIPWTSYYPPDASAETFRF